MGGGVAAVSAGLLMFRLEYVNAHESVDEPTNKKADKTRTYHTAGQVLLWAGVVGVGTGVSLVVFAPKDKTAPSVAVGLGHVALSGHF